MSCVDTVSTDLESQLAAGRVVRIDRIPESHSGFLYSVEMDLDGHRTGAVLRLPPPGAQARGPADVVRQGRIMDALQKLGMPAPRILAMSSEPVVDGRPFVLMEKIVGDRVEVALESTAMPALVHEACRVAKAIHAVPAAETGIAIEHASTAGDEVSRWTRVRQRPSGDLLPTAEKLGDVLAESAPRDSRPALVHGDYHMGNFLFRNGRIVAVVDWEIAQLGDPMFDLAALCLASIRKPFGESNSGGVGALDLDDMLAIVRQYEDSTWHIAASCYKYAVILAYNRRLHRTGKRIDPVYDHMDKTIAGLISAGLEFV